MIYGRIWYCFNSREAAKNAKKSKANLTFFAFFAASREETGAAMNRHVNAILERDAEKWFKPAKGQFQIFYKQGADHLEYQPDFVAETNNMIYMLEPKASNQMADPIVLAKKEAALKWCKNASDYSVTHGGKPWCYVLIPHTAIAVNMTLGGLAERFAQQAI